MRIAAGALVVSVLLLPRALRPDRVARGALAISAASFVLAAIPTIATLREAQLRGINISLRDALIGTTPPSPRSETVAFAPGLSADLYRPSGSANGAAIVVVHGGAWIGGDKGENVAWNAWLAERGYLVFDAQYRLAPQATWQDSVEDIDTAVGWLRDHAAELGINPQRIALLGRSSGAHLSLLAASTTSAAAIVALYPPTDLAPLYAAQDEELRSAMRTMLRGDPDGYAAASPARVIQSGAPPILLIHGTSDELVPIDQSRAMARALEAAHVPYELIEVPWSRHAFDLVFDSPASQLARQAVDRFLARQ